MSIALARKYRPSRFDKLIGQEAVSQTLTLALDSKRLSHAYLFSGLRGSGKTSTARIFAKALICEEGVSSEPCDRCSNCKMANGNRHLDIIELDGASNRKIDNIRELIGQTKYKPAIARYKIFIIDEVHMLTKEAFNALLKTLEEPPDFVKFILATTDPLKLPVTILSRTQHFRFKKISQATLERHLEKILEQEGVSYDSEAIKTVARFGAGSVRDALTLLDQAIVFSNGEVTIDRVSEMLGIIEPSILESLIDSIIQKDKGQVIEFISKANELEAEMVIDELIMYLKDRLLSGESNIDIATMDRFFTTLIESKSLLNIGADGEATLAIALFKMLDISHIEYREEPKREESRKATEKREEKKREEPKRENRSVENRRVDIGEKRFKELITKIYDRNYELGKCFEDNVKYKEYKSGLLTWESRAEGEEKKMLRDRYSLIRMFAQEIFGVNIKIKNIAIEMPKREVKVEEKPQNSPQPPPTPNINQYEQERDRVKKLPAIKRVMELFPVKKVTIIKKGKK